MKHANPSAIGFNCALGADQLRPHLYSLNRVADSPISLHPNAGLPNEMGEYDESPDQMASTIKEFLDDKLLNIVGGCCGTTPEHIAAIHEISKSAKAAKLKTYFDPLMAFSSFFNKLLLTKQEVV